MTRCFGVREEAGQHLRLQGLTLVCCPQVVRSCRPPALSASQDDHVLSFLFRGQGRTRGFGQ